MHAEKNAKYVFDSKRLDKLDTYKSTFYLKLLFCKYSGNASYISRIGVFLEV